MACTQPQRAWQGPEGGPIKWREPLDRKAETRGFSVPCGRCLSCRLQRGRDWAIRCSLELQSHSAAMWCTLTYDDEHLPPTLRPEHLSGFIKTVRVNASRRSSTASPIRFFACGEYGERLGRPHYHAILFGSSDGTLVEQSWKRGRISVDPLSPAAIAYVAGYCTKKAQQATYWRRNETFDPDTGEVLYEYPDKTLHPEPWQLPFLRMSRRPGIGAQAKEQFRRSWRATAIWHGRPVPAPRTFRQHWKDTASEHELSLRKQEIDDFVANLGTDHLARLRDQAKITLAKYERTSQRRTL